MGPLLNEMRTSPIAALVNSLLGIGGILGAGFVVAARAIRSVRTAGPREVRQVNPQASFLVIMCLGGIFLLGGLGFLLFALLQVSTNMRVHDRGLVWRRFGKKRIIFWVEVAHFGRFDETSESLASWSMLLRNGERIILHSGLYNRSEFAETMELIAEQIEQTQNHFG
jgi:hypothetical protein